MIMRFSDTILKNLSWKLLSLGLATSIWLTIHFTIQRTPKTTQNPASTASSLTLRLPIAVMTAATDARVFKVTPSAVDVTIRGESSSVEKVKASDIQVYIDVVDVVDARSLEKNVQIHIPDGVNLVKVAPTEVTVEPLLSVDSPNHPKKD
jgi:YbbR domain-containing protein